MPSSTPTAASRAPLYDVVATAAYPELSSRLATKIGGKYRPDDVLPRHWDRFARDAGLAAPMVRRRVIDLDQRAARASHELADDLQRRGHGSPIIVRLTGIRGARSAKLREELEQGRAPGNW